MIFHHIARSIDLPGGSIEESIKVDLEPVLDTGVPSVDVEGMQGDAPGLRTDVSAKKPKVNMSKPQVDMPEGKVKTQMSGPHVYSDVDLTGPSSGLDLPSTNKKSGNCLSCASSGDKDEPYSKGRINAGSDLDRPDMEKGGKVGVRGSGPEVWPNTRGEFSGPSVNGEGFDFDARRPDVDISARPKAQLDTDAPDIKTPEGKLRTKMSGPDVDLSTDRRKGPQGKLGAPTAELDLPSKKKKSGSCLSCAGGTDKDEPYKKRKGDADFDFDGPGRSIEMKTGSKFDISGSGPNIEGPERGIKQKEVGLHASARDVDLEVDRERNMDISGPGVSWPSSSAAASISGPKTGISGPERDMRGPKAGVTGPEVDIHGPKAGISGPEVDFSRSKTGGIHGPELDVSEAKPNISGPELDVSGPNVEISAGKPKVGLDTNAGSFNAPKGEINKKISGPDVDVSAGKLKDPRVKLDAPSAELGSPSKKTKAGSCLSCAGGADKDEPYRKTKGNAEYAFNGPEGGIEGPDADIEGLKARNQKDFKVHAAAPGIDVPSMGGDVKISRPSGVLPSTSGGVKLDVEGRRPDLDVGTGKPSVELDSNAPNLKEPKGKLRTEMSGPDLDVSTGNIKGPKANLRAPSADGSLPSAKKSRGNCLSCAGDADKDEPYGKPSGNVEFKLDRPDTDGSMEMKKGKFGQVTTAEIDLPSDKPKIGFKSPEFDSQNVGGKGTIDIATPEIDLPSDKPTIGFKPPEFDTPKTGRKGEVDIPGPDFSHEKPMISEPSIGVTDRDISIGRPDLNIDTPLGQGDWGISKPDISASPRGGITEPSIPGGYLDINVADLGISGKKPSSGVDVKGIDTDKPNVPVSDLRFGDSMPDLDVSAKKPTIELDKNKTGAEGKLDLDVNRPDLDVSATKPRFGGKDLDLDIPEPNRGGSFQPKGKEFDGDFDWGVKTSTPKVNELDKELKLHPEAELELEAEPLEGDISVAKDYNFDLQSTPKTYPSVDYEEPRSLQRYDEIRPDMELRLLSPTKTDQADQSFDFEIPDSSIDMEKDGKRLRPGRMSLVKVEENVTVCSASVEVDELPLPRKRTLTLDREIKQKIEVEFPDEEGSNAKPKSSTSSSSSSSSEADVDKQKKPKRKKKSRLLKAFRKSSTSSESSKEDAKRKGEERKPSTSSSSSDDDEKSKKGGKKHPSKDIALPVATIEQKKVETSSSSSSSDETPLKINRKDLPKRRGSKSSSSSSDKEKQKGKAFAKEMPAPEVTTVTSIKLPEPDISVKGVTPDSPSLPSKSEKPKERKSSTSSSSSEDEIGKKSSTKQKGPKERKTSTNSASSSDKDTKVTKPSKDVDRPVNYNVEYTIFPKQCLANAEKNEPETPVSSMPTVVSHSLKPTVPDASFVLEKPEDKTEPRKRKSSTSSSSDEETPKYKLSPEDSKPSMLYQVEYVTNQQKYIIEPHDDLEKPVLDAADVQEDTPEVVFQSIEPKHPDFTYVKPTERKSSTSSSSSSGEETPDTKKNPKTETNVLIANAEIPNDSQQTAKEAPERKSSTSSSSSEDSVRLSPTPDVTVHSYETVHHVLTPDYPSTNQEVHLSTVQEHPFVVVSRSFKRPVPEIEPQESTEIQFSEPPVDMNYHLEYPYNIEIVTEDNNRHAQEEGIVPVVKSTSVEYEMPDFSDMLEPPDKQSERKSSTSSSSSEDSGRLSPTPDVTVHSYETVHHVLTPDYRSTNHEAHFSTVQEHPFVVVSRSFKRPVPEIEPDDSTEIQFSEPPVDMNYHLEYPYNIEIVTEDNNRHVQEEGIVPVVKSTSVEYEMPDFSDMLEPPDKQSQDDDRSGHLIPTDEEDRASPTWDIQTHTFETVYNVTIPDNPTTDGDSFEIQEHSPIVVSRSMKRITPVITPEDENQEEEPPLFYTSTTDVQFSEPSADIQLEYPGGGQVFTTDEHNLKKADEEWIVTHSVQMDKPDIPSLLASLDRPEEVPQSKTDSSKDKDGKPTSPQEKSPRDTGRRRSSNSRLWDLMQGYLIERPVMDDDETEPSPEKTEEIETPKTEQKGERTVYQISQPAKFETVNIQVQFGDEEPAKEVATSVAKVESHVPKVTPISSQFDPVTFHVNVGDNKPAVKEHHAGWRKQPSLPVDVDDNEDDPWMRHYSKGLQRSQHQPAPTKSLEKEPTFAQSRGLSLSKVPHVKGPRSAAEKERERPRYAIETRIRPDPTTNRSNTEKNQARTSREETTTPSVSSLRSFWEK